MITFQLVGLVFAGLFFGSMVSGNQRILGR